MQKRSIQTDQIYSSSTALSVSIETSVIELIKDHTKIILAVNSPSEERGVDILAFILSSDQEQALLGLELDM